MPGSTYSTNLKVELMATGENSGTWGDITNTNLGTALEQAIVGYGNPDYASDANLTISITNSNAAQAARALVLNVTSSLSLTATRELVVPTIQKQYIVQNNTTGSQSITVKTSAGTGITVPNGRKAHLYVDGTNVIQMFDFVDINGGAIDGTTIGAASASTGAFTTLNASGATTLDGNVTLGNASGDNVTVTGTITSNLLFTDNTYDIGASGATRPRNLFLAGAATIGGNLSVGGTLTLTGGVNLNGNVTVGDSSNDTLTINSTITSNLIFTDNTYDIGASGATRPRNLFLAGNSTIGGNETVGGNLAVDGTTDSSSTITGSLQTDGGLGVAKAAYIGTTLNIGGLTSGRVAYVTTSGRITDSANLTFDGTTLTAANFADSSLTSGRVTYATTSGNLTDSANLLYSGTDLTVYGITVGRGAGAVSSNTAVGASALNTNTTGARNVAVGGLSSYSNSTGSSNIFVGYQAGYYNTTSYNIGIGDSALVSNTSGASNVAVGHSALQANTTASNNTAVGYQAGYSNTTGANSTMLGFQAGYSVTTEASNTYVGKQTGYFNTADGNTGVGAQALKGASGTSTGRWNTAVGAEALTANTSGAYNAALGGMALQANTTGSHNTAVGGSVPGISNGALELNTTGSNNIAVGSGALRSNTTASNNTAVGYQALYANTTATGNTAVGAYALDAATTGGSNTAVGIYALTSLTTGVTNSAFGEGALISTTTGSNNTALGYQSLQANTTASNNTAVGYQAGYSNTTGEVSAFGVSALRANTTGVGNAAFGLNTLYSNTTGSGNSAFGTQQSGISNATMYYNTTGANNSAFGTSALRDNTTGSNNTAMGYQALLLSTTASNNTVVGYQAGYTNTTGYNNALFGQNTGASLTTGYANTFIGRAAGEDVTTGTRNTILGRFSGNQGGLDIRTASNNIVLSDGDGTPQFIINGSSQSGLFGIPYSGWDSTRYRSLQFGNSTSARYFSLAQQYTAACAGSLLWNAYGDGDNIFKYAITGDRAAMIQISSDAVNIYGAPSGTAGNTVAWSTLLGVQRDYSVALQGASGQSGTGITFPATQNASSNANTLDDYEEGTWTPVLTEAGTNRTPTYQSQGGRYVKIGNTVYCQFGIALTNKGSGSGSGQIRIEGLPFTGASYGSYQEPTVKFFGGGFTTATTVNSLLQVTGGTAYLRGWLADNAGANVGATATPYTEVTDNSYFAGEIFYNV